MDYKECIQRVRRLEVEKVYIDVIYDIPLQCKEMIKHLLEVEYKEESYHAYYGDIKYIIKAFINFWEDKIDKTIIITDKVSLSTTKDKYLEIIEQTINSQNERQIQFGREYLPINSKDEKDNYEYINHKFNEFMKTLYTRKNEILETNVVYFPMPSIVEEMKISLKRTHMIFELSRELLGTLILYRMPIVKWSLQSIFNRINHNFQDMQTSHKAYVTKIDRELYEGTTKALHLKRQVFDTHAPTELAELSTRIKASQKALRAHKNVYEMTIKQFKEELKYWHRKILECDKAFEASKRVLDALKLSLVNEEKFKASRCAEREIINKMHCLNTLRILRQHREELYSEIKRLAKTAVTLFAVKGFSRKLLYDEKKFYIDQSFCRVYNLSHGRDICKMTCDGSLKKAENEKIAYKYDASGRYYLDQAGVKIYVRDQFGSSYKLDQRNLLTKVSKDCGHSIFPNKRCHVSQRVPTDIKLEPMDIKGTMDAETTKYIWDCFGSILPDALADVEKRRPKNPMFYLAHRLLVHKYGRTRAENKLRQEESVKYREAKLKEQKDKIAALKKSWKLKCKQAPRRHQTIADDPEFDTYQEYDAYKAMHDMIKNINTDYYQNNIPNT